MTPELFMPFYGQDFDRKTKGWPRAAKWSYLAVLWAYWCDEARGIANDEEIMRKACECDPQEWGRTRGLIFGDKFKLIDGRWHQTRAQEEYLKAKEKCRKSEEKARKAAEAKWEHAPSTASSNAPSIQTGNASIVCSKHTESESESDKHIETEKQKHTVSASPPVVLTGILNTAAFKRAWHDWLLHLKQKRKPPTKLAMERQLAKLEAIGEQKAIETLNYCIEKNWQGIFEIPDKQYKQQPQSESIIEAKNTRRLEEIREGKI